MSIKSSSVGCASVLVGLTAISPAAVAQRPGIASNWWGSNLSFNRCMDVTSAALRELGFTPTAQLEKAVGGIYGDYMAQVICATAKGVIVVVVAGPDGITAAEHMNSITQKIQKSR